MNERYRDPANSRSAQQVAFGYQSAATNRMVELDCP